MAVKASAGGGGKGFRVALRARRRWTDAFEGARREGERFFADGDRLPRALPARAAPRRDPDPGRRPRRAACGWASATARCSAATRSWSRRRPSPVVDDELRAPHGRGVGARRAGRRLHLGRHARVPGLGRRVLLPRDEHPHPGGAHDHRGGHAGSTWCASRCGSPPASRSRSPRRTSRRAATPSSAASTPRTPRRASSPPPPSSRPTASRPGRACGSTRACGRGRRSPRSTTR